LPFSKGDIFDSSKPAGLMKGDKQSSGENFAGELENLERDLLDQMESISNDCITDLRDLRSPKEDSDYFKSHRGSVPLPISPNSKKREKHISLQSPTSLNFRAFSGISPPDSVASDDSMSSLIYSFSYKDVSSFYQDKDVDHRFAFPVSRKFTKEEEHYFLLIGKEGPAYEKEFCEKVLDCLYLCGEPEQALEFADTTLTDGAPDVLLRLLVDRAKNKSEVWHHIIRIRDTEAAANVVLTHLSEWDIDICIELLSMCKYRLGNNGGGMNKKIIQLYDQMKAFKEVLTVDSIRWKNWQELSIVCENSPSIVVRCLMELKQWGLARQIAELFDLPEFKNEIEESRLVDLLITNHDPSAALQALASLSKEEVMGIVERLVDNVVSPRMNDIKLFLLAYILNNFKDSLSPQELEKFSTKQQGVKVLSLLSEDFQEKYQSLLPYPSLILESLVMSEHLSQARVLIDELPELRDEKMILKYAQKALTFPENRINEGRSGMRSSLQSNAWVLTGDTQNDRKLRKMHKYVSAPSINLGKNLLNLVSSTRKAGETCLMLCDKLSSSLLPGQSNENAHTINLIQELLRYAKLQFMKDPSGSGGVSLCDTILSHVELLQSLVLSGTEMTDFSLMDFSDTQKARQLRDRLISGDKMKMALEVATKCNIEREPVWAEWGLSLLEMGFFDEAKEKFKYCLVPTYEEARKSGSRTKMGVENDGLLSRIIKKLESGPSQDAVELRSLHSDLLQQISPSRSHSRTKGRSVKRRMGSKRGSVSNLDSIRLMQCVYYLRLFGSPRMLVNFWISHNLVDDACSFILTNNLSPKIFIDEVFTYCIARSAISDLKRAMLSVDPKLSASKPYLLALCKYLNNEKAYSVLLEFQLFMKDNVRAGLTSIQLFQTTDSPSKQIRHLESAKQFFDDAMIDLQNPELEPDDILLNQTQISKRIRSVNLQMEVTKFFYTSKNKKGPSFFPDSSLSLFSDDDKKSELAEIILVLYNFDLAFRIIQEFRLSIGNIYINAISLISKKKATSKVNELLQFIKGTVSESQWDKIVLAAIEVYATQHNDPKTAQKFASKLSSWKSKVTCFILCKKLKSGYLLAVKHNGIGEVEKIRDEAKRVGDRTIQNYCDKWLNSVTGCFGTE